MGLFDAIGGLFGGDDEEKVRVPQIDPNELITRQAQVNRVNQITPFGKLTFSGPDRNTLNFELSPQMQRLFNQQAAFGTQSTQQARGLLSAIPGSMDAAVNAQLQRLQPTFDLQESRLRERLEQSGNPAAFGAQFSEGAFNDLALLNQSQNDARLAAILQGPAYQGQLVNNAVSLGTGSPIGVPQFNFQGATPIDVMGPYSLGQNAGFFNAQQNQRRNSSNLGGLFDIGSAILGGIF